MTAPIDRRTFLELGVGGLTALALAPSASVPAAASGAPEARRHPREPWFETDIATLQHGMRRGRLTSAGLTSAFLTRIAELNPVLHAVIESLEQFAWMVSAENRSPAGR